MNRFRSVLLLGAAAGCINTNAPDGFVFQYQIGMYGCDSTCAAPGTTALSAAARGDTVWLRHDIVLLQASDTARRATVRPDCAENVLIQLGSTSVDTVPAPSCPDSLAAQDFVIGTGITRFNQWIVDPALAPGVYSIVGRVLVLPRIEPTFGFTIQ